MGKHAEWRKLAKKCRRKRIRQSRAKLRCQFEEEDKRKKEKLPGYKEWLEASARAEEHREQEESRLAIERALQWRRVEEEAQRQWQELQKKLAAARRERAQQNEKIREEWEKEQQRQKQIREQKEYELQQKLRQEEILKERVEHFIANGGDTPEHLKVDLETNPSKQPCPFFIKVSACRFHDACSRNHVRPSISRILLIPNFFCDYSLETAENEHGSDSSLEFENHETYDHYKQFFYDVIPELETYGTIKMFKTCCNHEQHLRGNVYVEFETTRAALKCYRSLNSRWYGGKQLNVEFCKIKSWRTAICGLHFTKRCPKGNSCNFLHVFRNPKNLYNNYHDHQHNGTTRSTRDSDVCVSDRRNWRWSESPEQTHIKDWEDDAIIYSAKKRSRSRSRDRSNRSRRSSKYKRKHSSSHSRTPERSRRSTSGSSHRHRSRRS